MIKANNKIFFQKFFNWYGKRILHRHFHKIVIQHNGISETENKSLLVAGNHFSWWDGFIGLYVNNRIFRKTYHVMMLEEQLKSRMFLSKSGAFGIVKTRHEVRKTLDYCNKILQKPENILFMYPQGEIQTQYQFPLKFEKGLYRIFKSAEESTKLIFMSVLTDYFSKRKPTLYVFLKEADTKRFDCTELLEEQFNQMHSEHIQKHGGWS